MLRNGNKLLFILCLSIWFGGCATHSDVSVNNEKQLVSLQNNLESSPYQVIESANNIIKEDSSIAEAHYLRAQAYHKMNNDAAAEIDVKQALKIDPDNERYMTFYANLLCLGQNYQKAQMYYDNAYSYSKKSGHSPTSIYIGNGDCLTIQNKLDAAIASYTSALSDESAPITAYIGIAHAYLLQNNYAIANYYLGLYRGAPTVQFLQIRIITLNDLINQTGKIADRNRLEQTLNILQKQLQDMNGSGVSHPASLAVNKPRISQRIEAKPHAEPTIKKSEMSSSISTKSVSLSSGELSSRINTDSTGKHYIVIKPGDTLYRIGVNTNISTQRLKEINHLKSNDVLLNSKFYLD